MGGLAMPGTEAHANKLGIYKTFAISGGVQFPIYRNVGSVLSRERFRIAINFTYFLFKHGQH